MDNIVKLKRSIGFILAPTFALVIYLLPLDLNEKAHIVFSILVFNIIFWLFEVIPLSMTAILGVSFAVIFGVVSVKEAFKSLGHPVVLLFIGSFLIATAMSKYGLDRRIALNILSSDIFLKSPFRLIIGFSIIAYFLSFWISNTATTAILLPLSLGIIFILKQAKIPNFEKFTVFLLLSIAYASSIGGATTLIGTPTNLVGAGFLEELGYNVDFVKWFTYAFPITFLTYIAFLIYIKIYIKSRGYSYETVKQLLLNEKSKLPSLNRGEINTIIAFLIAVSLWSLPGILNIFGFEEIYKFFKGHLPDGLVAILSAIILFLLPNEKREPTLTSDDLKGLDWDTILLFGGGIALGQLIMKTGLADYIGKNIAGFISPKYLILFIFILILSMVFLTEVSSNTATVLTFVPILIGILKELNIDLFFIIFGVVIAGSFAFMLPIATPPNAIIYGSKLIPLRTMVKVGLFLNIIGAIIITCMVVIYMNMLR